MRFQPPPCHNPDHAHLERDDAVRCFADAADKVWQDIRGEPQGDSLIYAVKVLRDRTGAGIVECREALQISVVRTGEDARESEADRLRAQIRAQVAEEIAVAIESTFVGCDVTGHAGLAARIAREIGARP